MHPLDEELARLLREASREVSLAKTDNSIQLGALTIRACAKEQRDSANDPSFGESPGAFDAGDGGASSPLPVLDQFGDKTAANSPVFAQFSRPRRLGASLPGSPALTWLSRLAAPWLPRAKTITSPQQRKPG